VAVGRVRAPWRGLSARASAAVASHVAGKRIVRVIYVPNRLLNIVVKG
jgi:hypothetical protein